MHTLKKIQVMNDYLICRCPIKDDLNEADDLFAFLDENYPIESLLGKLDNLSQEELKCACCLFGSALLRLSRKTPLYKRLLKKIMRR